MTGKDKGNRKLVWMSFEMWSLNDRTVVYVRRFQM